ncbi:MAG: carbohydrate-binding family 9-like protein [Verrucomicrobiales bacterium]|nr:carbohydrate-binding family 9-like protein [Verrucomicrobiales bacterium]
MSEYHVRRAGPADFSKADCLSDFTFPWIDRAPPNTEFRAVHDGGTLYFQFEVEDEDLVLGEPIDSDRVEIFIAIDEALDPYYGFEMDPQGGVLDYRAKFHREFDFDWTLPEWKTDGEIFEGGYRLTGSVPLSVLENLGCLQSGRMMAGAYRAEFSHGANGEILEDWMSWIDPLTKTPDFHVPNSFGTFVFED